jgi:hypothetical protein
MLRAIVPQFAKAKTKLLIKSEVISFWAFAALLMPSLFGAKHRKNTFQAIYRQKKWGDEECGAEFFSGFGSRGTAVTVYVARMASLIEQYSSSDRRIKIIDLGCGDFAVGRELVERIKKIEYIGCDIVPELIVRNSLAFSSDRIHFKELDIVRDDLPEGNICLIRQVFQHMPNEDIQAVLSKLGIYKDVFITEALPIIEEGAVNPDKPIGPDVRFNWRTGRGRGVELDKPPYNMRIEEVFRIRPSRFEMIVTYKVWTERDSEAGPRLDAVKLGTKT